MRGLYALPPGADFAAGFVRGLLARMQGSPPEALAARLGTVAQQLSDADPAALRSSPEPLVVLSYVHGPSIPAAGFVADLGEIAAWAASENGSTMLTSPTTRSKPAPP